MTKAEIIIKKCANAQNNAMKLGAKIFSIATAEIQFAISENIDSCIYQHNTVVK